MIILEIIKLKKDYQITFSDSTKIVVDEDTLVKYRLVVGKVFDDLELLEKEKALNALYQKVARFTSYGKSVNQVIKYLHDLGMDDTEYLITKLKKEHYLNDSKLIRSLLNKDYSYLQLVDKLNFYQFDQTDIDGALGNYDEKIPLYKVYKVALKKYHKELPEKKKEKIYRYLVSKGFNQENILSIMN